jgi:hypothetical protein
MGKKNEYRDYSGRFPTERYGRFVTNVPSTDGSSGCGWSSSSSGSSCDSSSDSSDDVERGVDAARYHAAQLAAGLSDRCVCAAP